MPSPSTALTTLRPELGSMLEFDLDQEGFIAHRVLPVLEIAKQAGTFGKIPIEQLLQNRDTKRAPGSGYSRGKFTFLPDTFACEEHGVEEPIDDRQAEMYRDYFDAEVIAARRAVSSVMVEAEKRVAAAIFNATTWTGGALTSVITEEWDDAGNAVPIADVAGAVDKVYDGTGLWPNALIINRRVFRNLRKVDEIKAILAASGAGFPHRATDVTVQQLAEVFDLPFILVAGGTKNSAAEGQAATPGQIWSGEYAMVARIAVTGDIQEPGLGRTFHWGEDGSDIDGRIESYRDEPVRSEIIRVRHDVHEKIIYVQAAHLLSNVTT